MPSPLHRPATELVRLVADGTLSAVDLVTAHLEQIDRLNPQLNAFVDIRRAEALAEARAQDALAAGGAPRGPLGGLPVTVKSAIEVTANVHRVLVWAFIFLSSFVTSNCLLT